MAQPKSWPLPVTAPDLDILGDQVTIHPGGYVAPAEPDGERERNLVEHMSRFRESPLDFLREISLHVSGEGWRAYDDPIGQPIFYNGFSDNMKAAVMRTPMLQKRIEDLSEQRIKVEEAQGLLGRTGEHEAKRGKRKDEIRTSLEEVALGFTDKMICKMESKTFIRGAYYLCTQLLTRAYHQGIHVSSEEVIRLRSVAAEAAKKKQSIIFLPCHRSHVDYVALQLICYRLGIGLPTVVAGDNLNFPVVGAFLQHAGAMYIRRAFGQDALYTTLVQSYIDTLLQNGFNFECFIEGGRSRTGKVLSPKFGILSFLLDSVLSGRVEDAVICPVSIQYDKVIETESYINELLGQPKPKESLKDFLSASAVLSLKLGRVDVRFHEPWSLKTFIQNQADRTTMSGSTAAKTSESRIRLLRTMGYRVLSDINAVSVVMPTALIGTVLLTLRGRGVGISELIRRVDWLCTRVKNKGGRVAHFGGASTETVVDRALEVLGPSLVGVIPGLPEKTYYAVDRFQLSFYRNMTIHLFISEALISAAMYTTIKQGGGPENQRISFDALQAQVAFLSRNFRGEFIYPTAGLLSNLHSTLLNLESDGIITLIRAPTSQTQFLFIELSERERRSGRENFDFYCFLIWPFIESSWLGAVSLLGLIPPAGDHNVTSTKPIWLDATKTAAMAQTLGKTLYHQGDLSYFEAVNKESLRNAYAQFQSQGMIEVDRKRNAIRLAHAWLPAHPSWPAGQVQTCPDPAGSCADDDTTKLWKFINTIALSRREGKNRRDGATVSTRVVGLVGKLGADLFGSSLAESESESKSTSVILPEKKGRGLGKDARL